MSSNIQILKKQCVSFNIITFIQKLGTRISQCWYIFKCSINKNLNMNKRSNTQNELSQINRKLFAILNLTFSMCFRNMYSESRHNFSLYRVLSNGLQLYLKGQLGIYVFLCSLRSHQYFS